MTTDRIKEIQAETAYPNSTSVQQALMKVWNECEQGQGKVKNCSIPDVSARYSLKDMEQIFFAGYFHRPIKNDDTEEGLDSAFKAVIDRHNSNVR